MCYDSDSKVARPLDGSTFPEASLASINQPDKNKLFEATILSQDHCATSEKRRGGGTMVRKSRRRKIRDEVNKALLSSLVLDCLPLSKSKVCKYKTTHRPLRIFSIKIQTCFIKLARFRSSNNKYINLSFGVWWTFEWSKLWVTFDKRPIICLDFFQDLYSRTKVLCNDDACVPK